jgi:hypothetical protein
MAPAVKARWLTVEVGVMKSMRNLGSFKRFWVMAAVSAASLTVTGCAGSDKPSVAAEANAATASNPGGQKLTGAELATQLDSLGLWRDLGEAKRNEARNAVAGGAHPWSTEIAPSVQFVADGEDLAEEGLEDFLKEVAPAVMTLGVELEVTSELTDSGEDSRYAVTINGKSVEIYNGLDAFERTDESFPWYAANVRPLARVNELLAEAGAKERFFVLYPGTNDGSALLIDPAIPAAMTKAGFVDPKETPLLAA